MQLLITAARSLAVLGGLVICYGTLFIYENEERQVQNVLEVWWIRLDDMRITITRRHIALFKTINEMVSAWLGRLFGDKFLSIRAFGVSACLSLASLMLVLIMAHVAIKSDTSASTFAKVFGGIMSLVALVLIPVLFRRLWQHVAVLAVALAVSLPSTNRRVAVLPLATAILLVTVIAGNGVTTENVQDQLSVGLLTVLALVFGIVWDYAAVIVLRRIVARYVNQDTLMRQLTAMVAQLTVGVAAIVLPLVLATLLLAGDAFLHIVAWSVAISAATNLFVVAMSLLFAAAGFSLALHRAVWPIVQRPLYSLARLRIFASKATKIPLFGVGAASLAVGLGGTSDVLAAIKVLLQAA